MESTPPRRLWALIDGLPPDSALGRHRMGGWTEAEHMTATLVETVDSWGRRHAVGQGWKPSELPVPVRFDRPGMEPPKPRVITDPRQIAAWFAKNA